MRIYHDSSGAYEDLSGLSHAKAVDEAREILHEGLTFAAEESREDWSDSGPLELVALTACGALSEWDPQTGDWAVIETIEETVNRAAPACLERTGHWWDRPLAVVGGFPENPGIHGVAHARQQIEEVCHHCGRYRVTRVAESTLRAGYEPVTVSWVSDPDTTSLQWVLGCSEEEAEALLGDVGDTDELWERLRESRTRGGADRADA